MLYDLFLENLVVTGQLNVVGSALFALDPVATVFGRLTGPELGDDEL